MRQQVRTSAVPPGCHDPRFASAYRGARPRHGRGARRSMDHDAVVDALRSLAADPSCRLTTLERLLAELKAQTLRDLTPAAELFVALFTLLPVAWASFEPESLHRLHAWTRGVLALPEFSEGEAVEAAAAAAVTAGFVGATLERMASLRPTEEQQYSAPPASVGAARASGGLSAPASGGDTASELAALQALLHWAYRLVVPVRAPLRAALGTALLKMATTTPVPPPALRSSLELLSSIIAGFGEITTAAHRRLLSDNPNPNPDPNPNPNPNPDPNSDPDPDPDPNPSPHPGGC